MTLAEQFSAYSRWRGETIDAVQQLRSWLVRNELCDAQSSLRLHYLIERLREDKLNIAFVAEYSRGKSELINAIFFSDFGDRILPSSTGRTTMCPTELHWSPDAEPELRLLPISTRMRPEPMSELRQEADLWTVVPLDSASAACLQAALARVSEVMRITCDEAVRLGFKIDASGESGLKPGGDGLVEVPSWRHAMIQFPHPLLEQGLVVLDTPGLNAIGAEPDLTLSLLPNAHAVLFILAADTGVTQSDMAVWRDYVSMGGAQRKGRMVVLNKIDGLWDGLRDEARIDAEIEHQVRSVAETLNIGADAIFPVSAQKGLVARVSGDHALLEKSRLPRLENALANDLLPTKQEIVRDNTLAETQDMIEQIAALLLARMKGVREQVKELTDLRGKNQSVIEYMMHKIRTEKDEFEQGLKKYYAVRSIFSDMSNKLLAHLGLDKLRDETRKTRDAMLEANFSTGLLTAMKAFFASVRANLDNSATEIAEITRMLDSMYRRFSVEHGLKLAAPGTFSTRRYANELKRLEKAIDSQFNTTLVLVTTEKHVLTQKFFETVAAQTRRTFELANRDVEQWLRAVMAPLEIQVREYQLQLKRRLESVKRIHQAAHTLEDRVEELQQAENGVLTQLNELKALQTRLHHALGLPADHESNKQPVAA
ncbi:MAG: dynamin family protein [Azoarcus sp.]|jgi:hypothetical protein|nr:dynamin family protein [Azoarcus sp.]